MLAFVELRDQGVCSTQHRHTHTHTHAHDNVSVTMSDENSNLESATDVTAEAQTLDIPPYLWSMFREDQQHIAEMERLHPVSYTHLTLPTILLV